MIDMKAEVNGLNEKVVKMLAERKMTVSAAESCTGGLFAALITNVSGASEVLNESFVTYANSAKMKYLGVKGETLEKHGAVSYETAFEMAEGLRKNTGADVTVGICVMGETEVKELHLNGTREEVRESTCKITFENIANRIENIAKVQ